MSPQIKLIIYSPKKRNKKNSKKGNKDRETNIFFISNALFFKISGKITYPIALLIIEKTVIYTNPKAEYIPKISLSYKIGIDHLSIAVITWFKKFNIKKEKPILNKLLNSKKVKIFLFLETSK